MQAPKSGPVFFALLGSLLIFIGDSSGQNQPPPLNHVVIPNPTPRPPDLQKEFGNDSKEQKKAQTLSVESQLRAREIWLESNQILLLTQQLDQQLHSGRASSMSVNAAKAGQVEKLARSIQQKMKVQ